MQDELRQQYLDSLSGRLEKLKSLIQELRSDSKKAEEKIRLIAHSLYGSGTTFGFPEISAASHKVEHAAPNDLLKQLPELINVLKEVLKTAELEAANKPETEEAAPEAVNNAPRNILIIDDDPESAALIMETAKKEFPEYTIEHAKNGKIAQEHLVKNNYLLIILDLILPDRDGRDLLREIRVDFQLKTPVLVLTGVNKDVIRIECMSLGADKVLTKPFDVKQLQSVITALLRKSDKTKLELVPIGPDCAVPKKKEPGVQIDLAGKSVLIAEDDTVQASLIKKRLTEEGLSVQHASNGREAMAALRTQSFSLVILDVQMPMLTGFEVLERIRGELGQKDVPIIMLTALGSEADIIKGYDLGASDYILKPFSPVQLIARVKSFLKK